MKTEMAWSMYRIAQRDLYAAHHTMQAIVRHGVNDLEIITECEEELYQACAKAHYWDCALYEIELENEYNEWEA
jgi:hypothetical protein